MDLNGVTIVECDEKPEPKSKDDESNDSTSESKESEQEEHKLADALTDANISNKLDIASTTRVFVRRQFIGGKQVMIGGIGEVCTKEQYRNQGYAELALSRSISYCRKLKLQLSSLHASAELSSYYASRHSYVSVDRCFGLKTDFESETDVNIVGEGLKYGPFSLRLMPISNFFSPSLLPQFAKMYEDYSSQFNGPLVRDMDYWENWVQSDLESSISARHRFPIEIYAAFEEWDGSDPAPEPLSPIRFLSYMFLQRQFNPSDDGSSNRDRVYYVREYACANHWFNRPDGGRQMFLSLAQYAVRQIRHKFAQMDPEAAARSKFTLKFPLPIVEKFTVPLKLDSEETDVGFMYRPIPLNMSVSPEAVAEYARLGETKVYDHRGATVEEAPIVSPFAAAPYVLHHNSEPASETSAHELIEELKTDAKKKIVFWGTDSF